MTESPSLQACIQDQLTAGPTGPTLAVFSSRTPPRWISYADPATSAAGTADLLAESGLGRGQNCLIVAANDRLTVDVPSAIPFGSLPRFDLKARRITDHRPKE